MKGATSSDRYDLYWYSPNDDCAIEKPLADVSKLDIGKEIAQFIRSRERSKYLGLDVESYLKRRIRSASGVTKSGTIALAVDNIGILLEPELGLKPEKVLMDMSQELRIFLLWPYTVENSQLFYWDSKSKEVHLQFPELTIRRWEQ